MVTPTNSFWSRAATSDWSFQASTAATGSKVKPISWQFGSPGPSSGFSDTPVALKPPPSGPPISPTRGAMGYLAFPPNGFSPSQADPVVWDTERQQDDDQEHQRRKAEADQKFAWELRLKKEAENRQQRIAREEAEARRGEEEWVRSGGTLRDAEGRRDMAKTQAVRDELKLREIEERLVRRWEEYERQWKELWNDKGAVIFQNIPWPVNVDSREALDLDDLNVEKVEDFLLSGLKVRGNRVTKKDRVRSSLLRWHPDKMTAVLARVIDEDMEAVKQGISVVMLCLQELNTKL
jgi:hypothetical protein